MDGHRHAVTSADGTEIGLLTAADGPPLLLVHGGMGCIESWQPLWEPLTSRYQVTAMDRRGRGSSAFQLAASQLASARCGSFHPGRTKWQVYPFG
jgi:pimeloyl-ACP methyl ester carboxylesterase